MTLREHYLKWLEARGMWHDQAAQVIKMAEESETLSHTMGGRWDHDSSQYDVNVILIFDIEVATMALAWIDTNLPRAFYRPIFAGIAHA
jgi:hypothetical protein